MSTSPARLLQPPRLTGREQLRPRLALADGGGTTEVWAAAGTGKTTLLALWAAQLSAGGETVLWIGLPVHGYLRPRLAALLQDALPAKGPTPGSRGNGPGTRVNLLFDDLHHLDNPAEGLWLADLISSRPRNVRFVLAGRQPPQLLTGGTARNGSGPDPGTVEYRTGDLAFTKTETGALLAARGIRLTRPEIDTIHGLTGGWAAALMLLPGAYLGTVPPQGLLTPKEQEILHELPRYQTVRHIAERQQLSPNTVKTHIRSLYQKLGVTNRTAAIDKALEQGLL